MDVRPGLRHCLPATPVETRRWCLGGRVQGVGFRPFVYRLALAHGLLGWVQNQTGRVEICTQGNRGAQEAFGAALINQAPPLARPQLLAVEQVAAGAFEAFAIRDSERQGEVQVHVPPDYFTCDDCLAELNEPADRRFRYPFINCTQCGPRYTLIHALPYDRSNTSMASFELCPQCAREYADPCDRRFHAEPVACPSCGPRAEFVRPGVCRLVDTVALPACVDALRAGEIIAVKGVGGYHLLCNARDDLAVRRLRERKRRPDKPLAVMFPAPLRAPLQPLLAEVTADDAEQRLLLSPLRPIVLAARRADSTLSPLIAPGLREVGVMLPYSPLHHVLLNDFGGPLVATSGNISGEPVLTENRDAQQRLIHVATGFLHHDRPIVRPADDPVYRTLQGKTRPLRLGRGCAPLELTLPFELSQPVIAVGGHMKNTVALAWERRAVISPHIGDMGSPRSLDVFLQVVEDLQSLYAVRAMATVCDAHPGYATTRWAQQCGLPVTPVYHHRAHASALAAEHNLDQHWLVFTWDGVGYGEDDTLWGGEALAGRPGDWQRVASVRPFRLPGGDKAAREPWRSAAAVSWEIGRTWRDGDGDDRALLCHAWQRRLNAPQTSAVGRLFDAAAALTGVCASASFEGQGPMQLEALCRADSKPVELPLSRDASGVWISDWQPLIENLLDNRDNVQAQAERVHASFAEMLVRQAMTIRQERRVDCIGLCGGVFQNRVLTELACARLQAEGFEVCLSEQVPMNDAGLCFGQVIEYGRTELAGD
ncbi:MAG: carbamoyltransferase HypF [Thiogranum sp.]|jgi:hydrogenase maturation protein HypF|nr:carbamoyltransferase HypF [Thiogranum sp.]